jgi:hypothetical protein
VLSVIKLTGVQDSLDTKWLVFFRGPVHLDYQPRVSDTFLSEQISTSRQPLAGRTRDLIWIGVASSTCSKHKQKSLVDYKIKQK